MTPQGTLRPRTLLDPTGLPRVRIEGVRGSNPLSSTLKHLVNGLIADSSDRPVVHLTAAEISGTPSSYEAAPVHADDPCRRVALWFRSSLPGVSSSMSAVACRRCRSRLPITRTLIARFPVSWTLARSTKNTSLDRRFIAGHEQLRSATRNYPARYASSTPRNDRRYQKTPRQSLHSGTSWGGSAAPAAPRYERRPAITAITRSRSPFSVDRRSRGSAIWRYPSA
jgi:hypothetical protein